MRELLDPSAGATLALPDDDELVGDLCAPKWRINSTGRIQVESKDDIRKRLGRSTDLGDAVVMAFSVSETTGTATAIPFTVVEKPRGPGRRRTVQWEDAAPLGPELTEWLKDRPRTMPRYRPWGV